MSKTFTAIVVEDEKFPRLSLLRKLEVFRPQIDVIDSCDNYDDALKSIVRNKPDILFLDIQLRGSDTIQLLEQLEKVMTLPCVIFTTAYNNRDYLMKAIKFDATDYLVKPISEEDLTLAIGKAVEKLTAKEITETTGFDKLAFRTTSGKVFINKDDIAFIRADGNYSTVVTFHKDEMILESLAHLERHLNPDTFLRTDRSTIINIHNLYKVNGKKRICVLRSQDGIEKEATLSKNGIDTLMNM
ncbi:MAG: response regulator transcription factor [Prevotella sp.]|jgi:DNA-binding LytR/AlgR family response regulator|nr:response regulator transcription factor [Prevotella sp.]